MSRVVETYMAYKFIRLLTKPWRKWDAYKMGLIDENGDVVREAENKKEKEQLSPFMNIVRNCKKLLSRFPGGKSLIGSAIAAGLLLKEQYEEFDENMFFDYLEESEDIQNLLEKDPSVLTENNKYSLTLSECAGDEFLLKSGVYVIEEGYLHDEPIYVRNGKEQVASFVKNVPYFMVESFTGHQLWVVSGALKKLET